MSSVRISEDSCYGVTKRYPLLILAGCSGADVSEFSGQPFAQCARAMCLAAMCVHRVSHTHTVCVCVLTQVWIQSARCLI